MILIFFASIYLPRYTQEYKKRSEVARKQEIELYFTPWNEIEQNAGFSQVQVDRYQLFIKSNEPLLVGHLYRVVGRVDTELQSDKNYLLRLNTQSISEIKRTDGSGNSLFHFLRLQISVLRAKIIQTSYSQLYPTESDLILGIVIGKRLRAQSDFEARVRSVGLTHITVASGSNLILFVALSNALIKRFLGQRVSIILSIILIGAYIMLVGFEPSILRAALFSAVMFTAILSGRQAVAKRSFFIVAAILLIYQPFIAYSLSFLLSLGATAGLIFILPMFENSSQITQVEGDMWKTFISGIQRSFQITLSTQIFTIPLILTVFQKISILVFISNIFAGFFTELLLTLGFVYVGAILIGSYLFSAVVAVPIWLLSECFIGLINLLSSSPVTTIEVNSPSPISLFLYYFLWCIIIILKLAMRPKNR